MAESTAPRTGERAGSLRLASTTLVIVGHGSHLSARSAEPAYEHAETLRDRGRFADVRTAFWKEEPAPREVCRTVATDDVIVVPLFMAAGYFTEEVIPRELRLAEASAADAAGSVRYADPVGTHEALTGVVVERADRITGDRALGDGVGLAIVGHGTERNANSAAAARAHAARIRERGRFDEVRALYLDESPAVDALTDHFTTDDVVIVPLFVADGHHTRLDIPGAVGLTGDGRAGYDVPATVDDHRVWYAGAVGTDPRVADVVLERAREVAAVGEIGRRRDAAGSATAVSDSTSNGSRPDAVGLESSSDGSRPDSRHGRAFLRWIGGADEGEAIADPDGPVAPPDRGRDDARKPRRTRTWGELLITATPGADGRRTGELRHVADRNATSAELDRLDGIRDLQERVRYDEQGDFRPVRAAPTLPPGWRLPDLNGAALVRAVETVYPATIANWFRDREGRLDVTHFRATADRQTGRYERLAALDRTDVETVVGACCPDDACLKRRCWDYDAEAPLDVPRGEGRLPCREPCSLVLENAREVAADGSANGVTD